MSQKGTPRNKYLCQAPRPNEWEELEGQVLGKLGSNAEAALEKTLKQLEDKYNHKAKSGPGRKSNAEHAVLFYQYLLDKVRGQSRPIINSEENSAEEEQEAEETSEDEEEEQEGSSDSNQAEIDEDEDDAGSSASGSDSTQSDDSGEDEDDNDDEEDDKSTEKEETEAGEDDKEFEHAKKKESFKLQSAQEETETEHNEQGAEDTTEDVATETGIESKAPETLEKNSGPPDRCDVCNHKGGRLIICSSCNLGFHLPCVRPVIEECPEDPDWRCSYCILSTEPKNTKSRRVAAAAVSGNNDSENGS